MPQRDVAAKRYAQAVASMAADAGAWDAWLDNLAALRVVLTEPSAVAFFLSSKVALEAKYRALDEALAAQLAEARSLAKLLVRKQRTALIEGIEDAFREMVNDTRGVATARVTTAVALDDGGRESVQTAVRRLTSAQTVELEEAVDPAILGGAVIQIGDHIIDGSVRTRLTGLRRSIAGSIG